MHIIDWIEEVCKYTDTNICKLVLANKCDLDVERKVSKAEIEVIVFILLKILGIWKEKWNKGYWSFCKKF